MLEMIDLDWLVGAVLQAFSKRAQTTKVVGQRFGPTNGCNKCRGLASGDTTYQYVHHIEKCRTILDGCMTTDQSCKLRVEQAHRQAQRLADMQQKRDEK